MLIVLNRQDRSVVSLGRPPDDAQPNFHGGPSIIAQSEVIGQQSSLVLAARANYIVPWFVCLESKRALPGTIQGLPSAWEGKTVISLNASQ